GGARNVATTGAGSSPTVALTYRGSRNRLHPFRRRSRCAFCGDRARSTRPWLQHAADPGALAARRGPCLVTAVATRRFGGLSGDRRVRQGKADVVYVDVEHRPALRVAGTRWE